MIWFGTVYTLKMYSREIDIFKTNYHASEIIDTLRYFDLDPGERRITSRCNLSGLHKCLADFTHLNKVQTEYDIVRITD